MLITPFLFDNITPFAVKKAVENGFKICKKPLQKLITLKRRVWEEKFEYLRVGLAT